MKNIHVFTHSHFDKVYAFTRTVNTYYLAFISQNIVVSEPSGVWQ